MKDQSAHVPMKFELVTDGLLFPEGPVAMADGSVLVVEVQRRTLTRVSRTGTREIVAELGGGPNGAAIGPDGAVYVCNNGGLEFFKQPDGTTGVVHVLPKDYETGSIQRVDLKSGKVATIYTECDGVRLNGPNDLVFDSRGGFWFSDLGKLREWDTDRGALYYALADGSRITCAVRPLITPNGVGLSPDGKIVWVAETFTSRVWGFDIKAPGVISPKADPWVQGQVLGPLPGFQLLDSLAVEADGKVCVATIVNGGITTFDPEGSWEHFPTPDRVTTNICFGGPDMRDAWITATSRGELYKTRWPRPGLRLCYNA
jgi:gluconolactonase